jgi:hypothetical protein
VTARYQVQDTAGRWVDTHMTIREKPVEPELPPHLPVGTRVWCYPKTEQGFEATVVGFRRNHFGERYGYEVTRADTGAQHGYVPQQFVVEFDENHNQKRAFAQGKQIQFRLSDARWVGIERPNWFSWIEYRIKPEPVIETSRCQCSPIGIGHVDSEKKVYVHLDATQTDGVITDVKLAKWEVK